LVAEEMVMWQMVGVEAGVEADLVTALRHLQKEGKKKVIKVVQPDGADEEEG
jgi:hypothetical protein